ncbi:MAG: glycosyltransferase [Polyangiaceae bacterium]
MPRVAIMHVITGLMMGGAEQMLHKQLSLIDRGTFDTTVVSLTDMGILGDAIQSLGVPVHALGMGRGIPDPRAVLRLARLIQRTRPSIVQTWLPHADLIGTLASRLPRPPRLAWNVRGSEMDFSKYRPTTRWSIKCLGRLSRIPDLVVSNSEAGRVAYENYGYKPRRWAVIPNGFDLDRFHPDRTKRDRTRAQLGIPADAFVIALVARFDPMKDHATALAALRLFPEAHLVAIGKDVVPTNPELAAPDLGGRLHLLGPRRDVEELLPAFDIATLSSAFGEGFPNVLGEAMACGLPCVGTDVGDNRAVIGDTGLVVPPRNPAALAQAWRELAQAAPERRASLGDAARARVVAHWSLPAIVRAYEDTYLSMLT